MWFGISDSMDSDPRVVRAGNAAMGLWMRCGAWSARHLTDGKIPREIVAEIGAKSEQKRLVSVGLLIEDGDDFVMADYLAANPTKAQVEAKKAGNAERQSRHRATRSDDGSNALRHASVTAPPTPTPITYSNRTPPPPRTTAGARGGGGGSESQPTQVIAAALDLAVAIEQDREPGQIRRPGPWRMSVRSRLAAEHGPTLEALAADGHSPAEIVAALGYGRVDIAIASGQGGGYL